MSHEFQSGRCPKPQSGRVIGAGVPALVAVSGKEVFCVTGLSPPFLYPISPLPAATRLPAVREPPCFWDVRRHRGRCRCDSRRLQPGRRASAAIELRRRFPGVTDNARRGNAPGASPDGRRCQSSRARDPAASSQGRLGRSRPVPLLVRSTSCAGAPSRRSRKAAAPRSVTCRLSPPATVVAARPSDAWQWSPAPRHLAESPRSGHSERARPSTRNSSSSLA